VKVKLLLESGGCPAQINRYRIFGHFEMFGDGFHPPAYDIAQGEDIGHLERQVLDSVQHQLELLFIDEKILNPAILFLRGILSQCLNAMIDKTIFGNRNHPPKRCGLSPCKLGSPVPCSKKGFGCDIFRFGLISGAEDHHITKYAWMRLLVEPSKVLSVEQ